MFSSLRLGSSVYILHKGEPPILKIGIVNSVLTPNSYGYALNTTCDIQVKIDDKLTDFKQLPAQLSLAIYENGNVIISDSKDLMYEEVSTLISNSKSIIESVPYHETVVSEGEKILKELSPQYAKLKLQEELITCLLNKVDGIENKLDNLCDLLNKSLAK